MPERGRRLERSHGCRHRDLSCAIGRETINSGGDGGKRNRREAVALTEFDGVSITGRQRLIFTLAAGIPDRADGVNHMPGWQAITSGNLGSAGLAAAQCAAFGNQLRAGRAMDRTIDAAAAQQRAIGRVDDRVNAQCRNIGDDDFQPCRSELERSQAQAEAGAARVTPLSANSCCSSPAWNISRIMSQPPTNSPLT
jgi:hypothetical protein